jgi:hypothetical protein
MHLVDQDIAEVFTSSLVNMIPITAADRPDVSVLPRKSCGRDGDPLLLTVANVVEVVSITRDRGACL